VLGLVFATYALVLFALAVRQLSDHLGRRRVIAAGLGVAIVGLILFAVADSVCGCSSSRYPGSRGGDAQQRRDGVGAG